MNLLAIDTSTECASLALAVGDEIRSKEQGVARQHAQLILPLIEHLMADAGLSFSQLDGLIFGRGPGSFTGLRIACSVAKGLAYAQDLPLFPVSSLAAIANETRQIDNSNRDASILAVLDARMNQLYWACYDAHGKEETAEQVSDAAELGLAGKKSIILAGVGYEIYLPQLAPELSARISQHLTVYPRAEAMLRLVKVGTIQAVSAAEAQPIYIRNQITQGEARG